MDKRPNYLDYAKAITIYLVILGHYVYCLELDFKCGPLWSVEHSITLFHMPLFFIASGILHKERPLKDQWLKTRDTLILPYIYLNLICLLIGLLIFVDYEQENLIKYVLKQLLGIASANDLFSIAFSGSLWFCYSLACIKLIMVATAVGEQKLKIKKQISRLSICIMGGGIMYIGNKFPFRIDSTLVGFIFFYIGVIMKDRWRQIDKCSLSVKMIILIVSCVVLYLAAIYNIDYTQRQGLSINAVAFGNTPILFLISGITGTICMFTISSLLSRLKVRPVLVISNGTIIILGFHQIIMMLCKEYVQSYSVLCAVVFSALVLAVCYLLIIFCSKHAPFLLGNRKIS